MTEVVLPIVIFQKTEKTLIYTAIQIARLLEFQPEELLRDAFPISLKLDKFIRPEELLIVLSRAENHPHILALLEFTSPNPLLCNRIYSLWKLFHQPTQLGAKLQSARETLQWHLARIYRARNLIVHEGLEVDHLPWLLDHLHYYFTATCGRVLDVLKRRNEWGVEEALA